MPAKLKICIWSPSRFRDNSCFLKQEKVYKYNHFRKLRIKNLQCLLNVADDVLIQKPFTYLDYFNWFSIYERFCEPRYL